MTTDTRVASDTPSADDERAIARYLYLLRTAPPEAIEQVHADAFRVLTEAQRGELLGRIAQVLPPYERGLAVPVNGTPIGLARLITRAEMRQPGTVARLFGPGSGVAGMAGMAGVAGMAASNLLGAIAGAVAVSAIAAPFLAGAALALAASAVGGAPLAAESPASGESGGSTDPGIGAGDMPADDAVADAGSLDDGGFDFGLGDLFDA
jgi:hypothetical protein